MRRCGTLSKALLKSRIARSSCTPRLRILNKSCRVVSSCVSQEKRARNPCWRGDNMPCRSRWERMWLQRMCSINLHVTQVRLTGLYFSAWHAGPFLNTGVTKAADHWLVNLPVVNDCVKMAVSIGAICADSSFKILHGTWLGPIALLASMLERSFSTPLTSK